MTYRLVPQTRMLRDIIISRYGTTARITLEVQQLATLIESTVNRMALSTPDGYPTTCVGAPGRGGGGGSSSHDKLGNLVASRERSASAYADLANDVATAAMHVALDDRRSARQSIARALAIVDEWRAPLAPDELDTLKKATRCAIGSSSMPGYIEWARGDCDNIAAPGRGDGLCDACRMRRWRWEKRDEQARMLAARNG